MGKLDLSQVKQRYGSLASEGALEALKAWITAFNPAWGVPLAALVTFGQKALTDRSRQKLERRVELLVQTVNRIQEAQYGSTISYESYLITGELIRKAFVTDHEEMAKEAVRMVEIACSNEVIDFDAFQDCVAIMAGLTANEYILLRKLPNKASTWPEVFEDTSLSDYNEKEPEALRSIFESLRSKGLVDINRPLRMDGDRSIIKFDDPKEKIGLSWRGNRFVQTLDGLWEELLPGIEE